MQFSAIACALLIGWSGEGECLRVYIKLHLENCIYCILARNADMVVYAIVLYRCEWLLCGIKTDLDPSRDLVA